MRALRRRRRRKNASATRSTTNTRPPITPPAIAPALLEDLDAARRLGEALPVPSTKEFEDVGLLLGSTREGPGVLCDESSPAAVSVEKSLPGVAPADDALEVDVVSREYSSLIVPVNES